MRKKNDCRNILIVGETIDGRLSTGSADLGKQALRLADLLGGRPVGVLIGYKSESAARTWSKATGISVIILDHEDCRYPNPSMTASGVHRLADECSPLAVCFPHTMRTCQAAATLAWRLKAPCITAVESIVKRNDHIELKRSIFGGKLCRTVSIIHTPMVMTIIPGVCSHPLPPAIADGQPSVKTRRLPDTDHRCIPLTIDRQTHTDQTLEKAQVVVSGGRGLGDPEHAARLDTVAGIFKSAAVGGSRGACDLGWLPHSRQIGETGRTVSPALYLACGISGAPQHLAGMRESGTIVAVNTDPKAAILNVAQYAVIEDLNRFLPVLRERYEKMNDKGKQI